MTLVRIIKNWERPDLMLQSPENKGIWDDVTFTLDPVKECDYVILLNGAKEDTQVCCPPQHVWSIIQEPPTGWAKPWHINPSYSFRTFTCDTELSGSEYIHSQPALPWHVNRDYDFLISHGVPDKKRGLSWITSTLRILEGHLARMQFLYRIREQIDLELIATRDYHRVNKDENAIEEQSRLGFVWVNDKWEGLMPYRYSLAIENFSNAYYWSEKIADCFLAWTMPIYYGCTRITDYFPSEAMISIDITAPDVVEQIQSALSDDPWKRNLDAIAYARELVLKRYQLFPFVVRQIRHFESCYGSQSEPGVISIASRPWPFPLVQPVKLSAKIAKILQHGGSQSIQTLRMLRVKSLGILRRWCGDATYGKLKGIYHLLKSYLHLE